MGDCQKVIGTREINKRHKQRIGNETGRNIPPQRYFQRGVSKTYGFPDNRLFKGIVYQENVKFDIV
jgi:hypothetical protein